MRSLFTLVVSGAAATLWVVGCGSDSSSPGGSAGTSADAQCHGDYAALTQAQFDAALDSSGACVGSSDRSAICGADVTQAAEQCGSSCFMMGGDNATQDSCVTTCLNSSTAPLSTSCLGCYVTDIGCAREHCLLKCGIDPTSEGCAACRVEFGCAQSFFACSGLPGDVEIGAGGAGGTDVATAGAAGN